MVGRELLGPRASTASVPPLDGLPPPVGEALRPIWGAPMNPARRARPSDFIETGISAIDGMNTLVRGQKLPIFSGPGPPGAGARGPDRRGCARAARRAVRRRLRAPSASPRARRATFLERFERSGALERTVLFLNQADDPTVERLLAPRMALTAAEYLAFEAGLHVLVVMTDMTNYCEALREIATAREEIPGRRGYPGLHVHRPRDAATSAPASLQGRPGSITQIPILTMPDDDITHPIPDLTGYITEGQIVL